jgi:CDP-diacylglycerol--glycerol-3-phosphate 3-phosphatidyltransferase
MTLYSIKPRFQETLARLAARLCALGVSAHALTALGVLFAALAGAVLALGDSSLWLLLAPPLLFARIAANALDGMVARRGGSATRWGSVVNETGDRVADTLCLGGLLLGARLPWPVEAGLLPLTLFVSYLGVVGQAAGGARRYEGPMGKADRMLLLGLYCLVAPASATAGVFVTWALLAGLALTAANRLRALYAAERGAPMRSGSSSEPAAAAGGAERPSGGSVPSSHFLLARRRVFPGEGGEAPSAPSARSGTR